MSSASGVFLDKNGKKTFIPLENNPEVFTHLVHALGVSPRLGFYDVYSIDEPELLALVPTPVHALLFIAPAPIYYRVRENDPGSKELKYDKAGADEPVMWFKQTIGHACGLIALLHSVSNGSAREFVTSGSDLDKILVSAEPLKPLDRAAFLYNSEELEKAHMAAAYKGDSTAPIAEDACGYHFISFVKGKDGHLYELEGSWEGPIDRGYIGDDNVISEKALDLGVRRYTKLSDGNLEFSIVALATKPLE
jgi:ubiquitin carboxyl-terminal hydrolase L3